MVDLCTRKKLCIGIAGIFGISLVILMLQGVWSSNKSYKVVKSSTSTLRKQGKSNLTCQKGGEEVAIPCSKCSKYELRVETSACMQWGFKETIVCDDGTKITRPCDMSPDVQEKSFWMFECVAIVIFLISYTFVCNRQKKLDRTLMDKINRQIAA